MICPFQETANPRQRPGMFAKRRRDLGEDEAVVLQAVLLTNEAAHAVLALEVHSLCVLALVPGCDAGSARAAGEAAVSSAQVPAAGIEWLPAAAAPAVARASASRIFAALEGRAAEEGARLSTAWNMTPLSLLHVGEGGGACDEGEAEAVSEAAANPPSSSGRPAVNWAAVKHLMVSGFALGAGAAVDGSSAPPPPPPPHARALAGTDTGVAPRSKRRCGEVSLLSFSAAAGVQGAARVLPLPPENFSPFDILRAGSPRYSLHGALVSVWPPLAQPTAQLAVQLPPTKATSII